MRLRGGPWEMSIRPGRGGRITSLKLSGEELLDQGIGVDDPNTTGFVEGGAFGWDEMVPNIEATDSLPDHGEAWRVPWQVVEREPNRIVMRALGRIVPWELERTIAAGDQSIDVMYRYTNRGASPHPAYWAAHPLFRFDAGTKISMPTPALADGASAKFFIEPGALDRIRLRWSSALGIEMSWDATLTPHVGIWMCNGDLGGYRQIAVETATGGGDGPSDSTPAPLLAPGKSLDWWLRITPL